MRFFLFALASTALLVSSIASHADLVYVWSGDGTIHKYDSAGVGSLFTTNNLSGWNGPVGLVLDNVGNLYAGVPSQSRIWKFSPEGNASVFGGILDSVSGLAFDGTGNLFATIPNYMEICRLDFMQGYGYFLPDTNYSQSHLNYPVNLAFNREGKVYVANSISPFHDQSPQSANTIQQFSENLTYLGSFATGLSAPWGLAFDSSGNLFVANSGTNDALLNTVVTFTPDGVGSIFATEMSGLNRPRGLAFDSEGNLYVANSGSGTILKFSPDGTAFVFASGLNSPTSIAIFPGLQLWSSRTIRLGNPKAISGGAFQFDFTDNPGLVFRVLGATNMGLSLTNWMVLGSTTEVSPGSYQFTDPEATNCTKRFYRVSAP